LENASAIPYLERALGMEQNEDCALQMLMDLQHLQKPSIRTDGDPRPTPGWRRIGLN
jgi:hypothetical protein